MSEADLPIQDNPTAKEAALGNADDENSLIKKVSLEPENDSSTESPQGLSNSDLAPLIEIAFTELEAQRKKLQEDIQELSQRKAQLDKELKTSFSGQADSIARRVKGFQEYLTGALQDLAQSAEQLELIEQPVVLSPSPLDASQAASLSLSDPPETTPAIADNFKPDEELILECLEEFLGIPDFYAEPWKLRRSLQKEEIEILKDWFFGMGGRGAQPSMGNRTRNVLISAALISILGELYGDRFQTLILASKPERLGEWRRGLQDALGLNREDFGPNSGIVLFERADGVVERADRLEERGEVPLIIVDAAEKSIETPVLQFPLWLAFAAGPEELYAEEEELL